METSKHFERFVFVVAVMGLLAGCSEVEVADPGRLIITVADPEIDVEFILTGEELKGVLGIELEKDEETGQCYAHLSTYPGKLAGESKETKVIPCSKLDGSIAQK
ncbi:MAG: hypothetical protein ABII07_01680 [Patescibacteria group bacterium]|nr:hypothetical protein [Patescibacteria group bacterium]